MGYGVCKPMTEYILKHISIHYSHKNIDILVTVQSNNTEETVWYFVRDILTLDINDFTNNKDIFAFPSHYTDNYIIYKTTDINLFKEFLIDFKSTHMV